MISFTGQWRTPMSITVEFRECSLPLTWTLTFTRIANTEPKSVTGASCIARVRIRTRTFSSGTWCTRTRTTNMDPWPFNETLACIRTRTHTRHKKQKEETMELECTLFKIGRDWNCVPKDGGRHFVAREKDLGKTVAAATRTHYTEFSLNI